MQSSTWLCWIEAVHPVSPVIDFQKLNFMLDPQQVEQKVGLLLEVEALFQHVRKLAGPHLAVCWLVGWFELISHPTLMNSDRDHGNWQHSKINFEIII